MTKKEQLQKELEEIERLESEEAENKRVEGLKNTGRGVVLKRAKCKYNLYYCSEYSFKEINDGFYRVGEILGAPQLKKDDILVFVQDEDGNYFWLKEDINRDHYLYCDEDYKMTDDEADGYIQILG